MGPRPFGRGRAIHLIVHAVVLRLQWGRDLSVAEGHPTLRRRRPRRNASMGPRPFGRGRGSRATRASSPRRLQWGRDLSVAEGLDNDFLANAHKSFNGAATFRSRKADAPRRAAGPRAASMGPRPFGRGRPVAWRRSWGILASFNGAATFRSRKDLLSLLVARSQLASMGPRPFGRGRRGRKSDFKLSGPASMGPRPFGRGRRCRACRGSVKAARFNGAATFRSRKAPSAACCA